MRQLEYEELQKTGSNRLMRDSTVILNDPKLVGTECIKLPCNKD